MWRTIKTALNTNSKSHIPADLSPNEVNTFFAELGADLASDRAPAIPLTKFPKHLSQFQFQHVNDDFIQEQLRKLPSSSNFDLFNMDRLLLKISMHSISPIIAHLVNSSLDSSTVPVELKQSKLSPIYKGKGSKVELGNYRPICITAHIAKILEKSVNDQLHYYLSENNILTPHQSAYLKGHSTITSLQKVTGEWYTAIDNKQLICVAYFDIAKCFNCIDHTILLYKLKGYVWYT
jgi:hypothetical protein